jgi:ABC-2 type transport system ATP-binding protein
VAHRPLGEFSKGMARRIGLAQALINDPDFLILDEPTSGLDPIGTRQVKDLIQELGRRGKTILLSSHLLADVEDVCDRMVVLYAGKIRAEGTVRELLCDSQRTVIETSRLAPETISRVERVIRECEGKGIDRVDSPRQRLESFFMDLVDRARREQVQTAGAVHGGATASFLRAGEGEGQGRELIESLVAAELPPPAVEPPAGARDRAPRPQRERQEVLASLTGSERPAPRAPAPAGPAPKAPKDVDESVIERLVSGEGEEKRKE